MEINANGSAKTAAIECLSHMPDSATALQGIGFALIYVGDVLAEAIKQEKKETDVSTGNTDNLRGGRSIPVPRH